MNLPKTNTSNKSGFTLIELMVVIAILAILAVVGFAIFNGQQRSARNARRQSDITAIANAMENNKVANSATYTALASTMFSGGAIPTDSGWSGQYCAAPAQIAQSALGGWAAAGVACGTLTGGTFTLVGTGNPGATAAWTVCAQLEGAAASYFCRSSSQS